MFIITYLTLNTIDLSKIIYLKFKIFIHLIFKVLIIRVLTFDEKEFDISFDLYYMNVVLKLLCNFCKAFHIAALGHSLFCCWNMLLLPIKQC